jgi:hypothetical protein
VKHCKNLPALALGLIALLGASCSTGAGDGRVWGSLDLPGCGVADDHYDMEVDFFAADYFENTLQIRLQRGGKDQAYSDGVLIMVRDVAEVSAALGDPLTIELEPDLESFSESGPEIGLPETTWDSPARVTLYLNETCPDNHFAFTDGAGEITFTKIYVPDESKRIAGSFELEFVDPREWEEPGDLGPRALLSGEFEFNYTRGSPAQTFPQ